MALFHASNGSLIDTFVLGQLAYGKMFGRASQIAVGSIKSQPGEENLLMGNESGARVRLSIIGGMAVLLAGCSMRDVDNPFMVTTNPNGKPTIWQCTLVKMATPAQYACADGKTYTASQLREFRLGTDKPTITNQ